MVTLEQIAHLKHSIAQSPDATDVTKQLLWWMVDHSENLTKALQVTVDYSQLEAFEIANGVHDMVSATGHTDLNTLIKHMGTALCFSFLPIEGNEYGVTVWLAPTHYNRTYSALGQQPAAIQILQPPALVDLQTIDMAKPELQLSISQSV